MRFRSSARSARPARLARPSRSVYAVVRDAAVPPVAGLPAAPAGVPTTRTRTPCTPDALAMCAELRMPANLPGGELAFGTARSARAGRRPGVGHLALGTGGAAGADRWRRGALTCRHAIGTPTAGPTHQER